MNTKTDRTMPLAVVPLQAFKSFTKERPILMPIGHMKLDWANENLSLFRIELELED